MRVFKSIAFFTLAAAVFGSAAAPLRAASAAPFYVEDAETTAGRTVSVIMGGEDPLRVLWEETASRSLENPEQRAWPTARKFGLHWRNYISWRPFANWHVWEWMKLRTATTDAIWRGRIRAAGKCRRADASIADLFWEYRRGSGSEPNGLVHARFMRRPQEPFLYCRLEIDEPAGEPLCLVLSAMPRDYPTESRYQTVVVTPSERRVVYARHGRPDKSDSTAWDNMPIESPILLVRGINLRHAGAGLVFLPEQFDAISSPPHWRDAVLELRPKPDVRVLHLAFWEYVRLTDERAMAALLREQQAARRVLEQPEWQGTRPADVIDLGRVRERYAGLLALSIPGETDADGLEALLADSLEHELDDGPAALLTGKSPAHAPEAAATYGKLKAAARERLEQTARFAAEHPVIRDAATLCRLYEQRQELHDLERRMLARIAAKVQEGVLPHR